MNPFCMSSSTTHFSPRNLLVTGGAGFIGTNFVYHWLETHPGDRVLVLDALTYAGNEANLKQAQDRPGFTFVHGNILDTDLVARLLKEKAIDTIVHFAAESHVDRSIHGPDIFIETNVQGTHSMLKAAREVWLGRGGASRKKADGFRFHHISTDEVYGSLGFDDPPFTESSPYIPNSPYSASKAASDHLVRAYCRTYGLPVTISNCSNNYGPYQYPEKLIPLCIVHMLLGRPLPVYGQGRNIRDWIHVDDHCRGIEAVITRGRIGQTYNIGGNCEVSNMDLVRTLCRMMDEKRPEAPCRPHEELIEHVQDRPGHDLRYGLSCDKITKELGWSPRVSLQEGVARTIDWYVQNSEWLQPFLGLPESDRWHSGTNRN